MSEEKIRNKRFKKKMIRSGVLLLVSFASFFLAGLLPPWMLDIGLPRKAAESVNLIFRGIYAFGTIAAVCMFCKTLHDPLTEKEAQELAEKEEQEKTK